jgi:hypothetical protein
MPCVAYTGANSAAHVASKFEHKLDKSSQFSALHEIRRIATRISFYADANNRS